MKHTTKEVTGCVDCPFRIETSNSPVYYTEQRCNHPKIEGDDIIFEGDHGAAYIHPYKYTVLNNCPLKEETITIVLKQD